jgi:putative aminopeptidase FrvX
MAMANYITNEYRQRKIDICAYLFGDRNLGSWRDEVPAIMHELLRELMMIPGLSGHEGRVRRYLGGQLEQSGLASRSDRMGNLIATIPGTHDGPTVMLFTHMDQIGFVVRRIEPSGLIRVERVGGIPEKVLAATPVLLCISEGRDRLGVFGVKSNHVTPEAEKYQVQALTSLFIDAGFESAAEAAAAGVVVGTPVVYAPRSAMLGDRYITGTSLDDRGGCAIVLEVARALAGLKSRPTVHAVFAVQEEYNVRGAMVAAQSLRPDIAIQLDLTISSDTPDLADQGHVRLGGGPVMSLYSFHGRGTLNGTIPHPAMVKLFEDSARSEKLPLQRVAIVGLLTDSSYVQFVGDGVACVDLAFGARYIHSPGEVAHVGDIEQLVQLITTAISRIGPTFSLDRDDFVT